MWGLLDGQTPGPFFSQPQTPSSQENPVRLSDAMAASLTGRCIGKGFVRVSLRSNKIVALEPKLHFRVTSIHK